MMHVLLWFASAWTVIALLIAPARAASGEEVRPVAAGCEVAQGGLLKAIEAIAHEAPVVRAHWGVAVSDMGGRCLAEREAHRFFHPASTAKLLTTAAVMSKFGPEERVTTRLEARGVLAPEIPSVGGEGAFASKPSGRVLHGDLVLVGAGDGALGADEVPYRPTAPSAAGVEPARSREIAAGNTPAGTEGEAMAGVLTRLSDAVEAAGIVEVDGDVVGDDTAFAWEPYPEDWAQDDLRWGYGAPVSALSLHDNQILIVFSPGAVAGEPVAVGVERKLAGWLRVDGTELRTGAAGGGTHVEFGAVPGDVRGLRVWGTIAAGAPELREAVAVVEPALFAAEKLRSELVQRGIRITGATRAEHRLPQATETFREQAREPLGMVAGGDACEAGGCGRQPAAESKTMAGVPPARVVQTLSEVSSPTVAEDVLATNKESLNLHAELLLERLGLRFGESVARVGPDGRVLVDAGSRAQGVRVVRSVLDRAGLDPEDVVLVDGSGLSTHDLVTPAAITRLLVWSGTQPWFAEWRATLPVGGVDGTLVGRFTQRPLRGRVQAKTGTLGESRALAGYLQCSSGRLVAFTVMVDGHAPGGIADREAMDRMVEAIYRAD